MKTITKKSMKEFICKKLSEDVLWIKKALLLIYSKQTIAEQVNRETIEYNNVGFTGHDSKFLSSVATQIKKQVEYSVENYNLPENEAIDKAILSEKQLNVLKRVISKYWRQVLESCDTEKLVKIMDKEKVA